LKLYINESIFTLIIFDLDGTFYERRIYLKLYYDFAARFITSNTSMFTDEAYDYLKSKGFDKSLGSVSVTDLIKDLGISLSYWNKVRDNEFDISSLLKPSKELIASVNLICKNYKTAILTNNTKFSAIRILKKIGFPPDTFTYLHTSDDSNITKPMSEVFEIVADRLAVPYNEILSIGDRFEIDIEPVLKIGGSGVLVNGPQEVADFLQSELIKK